MTEMQAEVQMTRGGRLVSVSDVTPETFRRRVEELRPPERERPHWADRRYAATRDIRDEERVEELHSVQASLKRESFYRRSLVLADAGAALAAVLLTAVAWARSFHPLFLAVPVLAVLISKIQGLYDRDDMVLRKSTLHEWRLLFQTDALITSATYLVWWIAIRQDRNHGLRVFAFMLLALFAFSLVSRTVARIVARRFTSRERCLIVGNCSHAEALENRLAKLPGLDLIGTISDDDVDCSVAGVHELVEQLNVERIVVVPHADWGERGSLKLIQSAKWLGVRVSLMPSVMTVVGPWTAVDEFDSLILLGIPRFGLSRSSLALKRALDLVVGTLVLLVSLPVMALVAVAIKLDSRGPALFRQRRIGRDGSPFTIYKFRSMVVNAEQLHEELRAANETDGLFKITDDPRVTRVGRFLRRTYLDELPQLFNVIRGDMSLVGPRPLVEPEDALLEGYDRHRSRFMPGMTGPWQLRGPMNANLSELAKLDYMYASNWSIWADIDILLGTAARILNRRGH